VTQVAIGARLVGDAHPVFIVAEIGINHNGDINVAKKLIDAAVQAGCDAVKFQKRTPEVCVPPNQRDVLRETPWGLITYLDYRYRIEFGREEYGEIDRHCRDRGITWFASCWDEASVDFMEGFGPPCYKVASASLTDDNLLRCVRRTRRPMIVSTGMSTLEQIDHAFDVVGSRDLVLLHATSTYPSKLEELNLRVIPSMMERYRIPIGYSGHEVGLYTTLAAVVLGACVVERHITLDRAMWGSDQAASVEPQGFSRLVKDIRAVEIGLGDGIKRVYDSEIPIMRKLRRVE
jgi:sialic acid synthase SpsE